MEEEVKLPGPKISDVEVILVLLFYGLLDLLDVIPGVGDLTDPVAAPMGFYYWAKGISAIGFLASEVIDLIPGLQEIPSRTLSWLLVVYADRHPKLEAQLAPIIEFAAVAEGDVGGVEGAAAETEEAAAAGASVAGRQAAAGERTLDMTQAEDGTWQHQPEEGEAGNARPSEKGEERHTTDTERRGGRESEIGEGGYGDQSPESEEERKKQEREKDYEEMMETDTEKEPIGQVEEQLLGEQGPPETDDQRHLREQLERVQNAPRKLQDVKAPGRVIQMPTPTHEADNADQQGNYLADAA